MAIFRKTRFNKKSAKVDREKKALPIYQLLKRKITLPIR